MKRLPILIFILALLAPASPVLHAQPPVWSVYFSSRGGCTGAIIHELDKAQKSVLVQAYSFTSAPIAKALLHAHKRGVKVEVILDKSQRKEKYSSADFLAHSAIKTLIDSAHPIAHNKVMVIDGEIFGNLIRHVLPSS